MKNLPITQVLPEVKEKLSSHNRLVLQAPPGAGKTTALPLALLDESWLEGKQIIMLEPRRLAVRTSARRMAELLGEKVGERIGYQIKMESVQSKKTKILIVTEGILTRKLQHDPSLEDVALVIFDEFHERSIHADLSLALALESQSVLREDLKLLIMSATLSTTAISKLLDDAPIVQSEGRLYPVERHYLDPSSTLPSKKELPSYIHKRLLEILELEEGNILVFLPGVREIKSVEKLLRASSLSQVHTSTLYGNLNKDDQDRAIKAPPKGYRKIVLSTNIAQTSLTIEGIKIVVDSGLQNISVFSPFSGMNTLERHFISQDSATQRAGRAGRLSSGKAYHIWHKSKILLKHDVPEILLADLTQMLLELALWGNDDIEALCWLDLPPSTAMAHAKSLLIGLGALDAQGVITAHGKAMSRFGLHPRLAHMILKAQTLGVAYEASLLAVLITEKDIYRESRNSSDIKERIEVLHDVAQHKEIPSHLVDLRQCRMLLTNAKRIEKEQKTELNSQILGLLLAFAYPDRIASLRHANQGIYLLSNGKGAVLHREDELFNASFLAISDLNATATNATIYKAIEINRGDIETHLTEQIKVYDAVTWSEKFQRVEVRQITRLGAIILKEKQVKTTQSDEVLEVLLDELEALGLEVLGWSREAEALRDRVNFVRLHSEESSIDSAQNSSETMALASSKGEAKASLPSSARTLMKFPDFSSEYLLENMDEWLAPYLTGITTLKACQNLNLYNILRGLLSYEQTQELDLLAPEKQKVASGSKITIDYSNPDQPILAVRLQEMFGSRVTPKVMRGKVPLMIHLLSPAMRPMQITQDLESFWANSYSDVKKEMRGKYKRHYWPDDPLEATATARTKKFM